MAAPSPEPLRFVAVLGPTASGKSALAMALAERIDGEIVSCDSMQVYRGMDIGTGKATAADRARVRHHVLDVVNPDEPFHAARWVELAVRAIADVAARGRRAIVVGGTGLYYRALLRGLFAAPPPDPEIRSRHRQEAAGLGVPALHGRLAAVDPEAAAKIAPSDLVRVSRALEIFEQTGIPASELRRRTAPTVPARARAVLLDPPLAELKVRITHRIDEMMAAGFPDEVRALRAAGYGPELRPMSSLGYRQLGQHLDGAITLEAAVAATRSATVAYARRQRTWFRSESIDLRIAEPPDAERLADEITRCEP